MSWFRRNPEQSAPPAPAAPPPKHREPGQDSDPAEVFEVWGDILDYSTSSLSREALGVRGRLAVDYMERRLRELLGFNDKQKQSIPLIRYSDQQDDHYLCVEWADMHGEVGVRVFGHCLDLFGILVLSKKFAADPNPLVRLAKLKATERRDVEIFQSLLKYLLEETAEALDEQRIG